MLRAATPRRTQAQRSQQMRQRILDAAVQVLSDKGYAGFRMADVAAVAGVSRGAQSHHFESKDALVLAALEHVFRTASQRARERAHRVRTVDSTMRALLEDSVDFYFSDLFLIAVDLAIVGDRASANGQPNADQIRELSRAHRVPVEAAWLAALIDAGVPAQMADDLLWLTISIVRGLAIRKLLADDPVRFRQVLALWRSMVRDFLRTENNSKEYTRRTPVSIA